ncbi:MAG: hypothetical protein V2I47_09105 [Bacteroidales bacterium]|nr:hypothetical protein [Bacteroidales bacterium]
MMIRRILPLLLTLTFMALIFFTACKKNGDDPNTDIPYAYINVVINPNSTLYQELNIVGGWMYYPYVNPPSRGLIIYRLTQNDFLAYERTPPVNSNACCDPETGLCTYLIVDDYFPFVYDTCSDYSYQIIDGSPIAPASVPLKQYYTSYDGLNLYINN